METQDEENQRTPKMSKIEKVVLSLGTLGSWGGSAIYVLTDFGSEINEYALHSMTVGAFALASGLIAYTVRNRDALTPSKYKNNIKNGKI